MLHKKSSSRKRGRPKFPKGKAKYQTLRVRVSDEEMKSLRAKSKRANLAFPKWVRKALSDAT